MIKICSVYPNLSSFLKGKGYIYSCHGHYICYEPCDANLGEEWAN